MESKKLEALMMSVDLGSFTRAAEVLGYTQSGLTHMMNSLEKEIGVPLLERGRGGVRLTPEGERVAPAIRDAAFAEARKNGGLIEISDNLDDVKDADVIYGDIWASMGEEDKMAERAELLSPYRVDEEVLRKTGNPDVLYLHCLPSFHDF